MSGTPGPSRRGHDHPLRQDDDRLAECPHGQLWSDPCRECEYDAEDDRCSSCGRPLTSWPSLGQDDDPVCETMSAHRCGYPVRGDLTCSRPWGHSAYDGRGHRAEGAQ